MTSATQSATSSLATSPEPPGSLGQSDFETEVSLRNSAAEAPTTMDAFVLRDKRKQLDMACFLGDAAGIRLAKADFVKVMEKCPPEDDEIRAQCDQLLQKADQTLQDIIHPPEPQKTRLNLRTVARLSHVRLAPPKKLVKSMSEPGPDIPREEVDGYIIEQCLEMWSRRPYSAGFGALVADMTAAIKSNASLFVTERVQMSTLSAAIAEWRGKINALIEAGPPSGELWQYEAHTAAWQGRRTTMEDRVLCFPDAGAMFGLEPSIGQVSFSAVYDGHGGTNAADLCQRQMHPMLLRHPAFATDTCRALHETFAAVDAQFCERARETEDRSGATATVVVTIGESLYAANVGDSSAILVRRAGAQERFVKLTLDHKASDEAERERVKAAGGLVVWYGGGWRVNGTIVISRAIGDLPAKKFLIPEPYTTHVALTPDDDYVIVASDGLWDLMKESDVVDFVDRWRAEARPADDQDGNLAKALCAEAIERGSKDNTSVVVLQLRSRGVGRRQDKWDVTFRDTSTF